jgi:hypothetical protein
MNARAVLFVVVGVVTSLSSSTAARAGAAPTPPPRSAVLMPIEAVALPEDLRKGIEADVRSSLPQHGVEPLAEAEATALLASLEAAGVSCREKSEECILRVGALAAVDMVVAGTLVKAPVGVTLDLVVIDVAALQTRARASAVIDARTPAARTAAVAQVVLGVVRPEAWRGQLKVSVQQPGATIVIDGLPRGFSPLPQPLSLVPGPHDVWVGLEGFRTRHERVEIAFRKKTEVKVVLQPGASEPLPISIPPLQAGASKPPPPPEEPSRTRRLTRVAVYEPTVAGVPDRVGRIVASYIAAEIRKRERVSVLDGDELKATLQAATGAPSLQGCSEERCLAEIADALGVDVVVLVQLTSADGEVFFGVRRIDQARQEVTGSVSERVAENQLDALLPLVGPAVEKLFADTPLRAGERAGVGEGAARVLHPPPLPPWLSTSFFAAGGLGLAAAAVLGLSWQGAAATYATLGASAREGGDVVYADALAQRDATGQAAATALATLAGASALVAVGGALSPLTDWEGLATSDEVPP